MIQRVQLHGGPLHGHTIDVEGSGNHFHVVSPVDEVLPDGYVDNDTPMAERIPIKEGTYSRVRSTSDFEWDGWVTRE